MTRHEWPYTTPSGHTYNEPATYEGVANRALDVALSVQEHWDPAELPPAPTWGMVNVALREAESLRTQLGLLPPSHRRITEAITTLRLPDGWWAEFRRYHDGPRLGVVGNWGMHAFIPSTDGSPRWYIPYLDGPKNHPYDNRMGDNIQDAVDTLIAEWTAKREVDA